MLFENSYKLCCKSKLHKVFKIKISFFISRYSHLHMYRLAFTPTCLDISSDKILVSGKSGTSENCFEMSVFRIPAKLMTTCPEEEGMTKERDFSLVAGVTHEKFNFLQVRLSFVSPVKNIGGARGVNCKFGKILFRFV